ncbi:MAG: AsmA family protein [Alphaproteobacteria bacterium]|nr:AsmA family protein [Alphaproteobacteria bacterium]
MKKLLIGLGILVVIVIAAALVIPAFIPVDVYKNQIIAQIEGATGRKAKIDGDFKLSILPRVEFVAGKVALGNAKGGKAADMMSLDKLTVRVGVFPLLSGNLEVDALVAEKPVINLEVDPQGRPNWQFDSAQAKPGAAKPGAAGAGSAPGLAGLKLGDVRLVDGRVSYLDMKTGVQHKVEDINLKVALPSLSSPMEADGGITWNKEKLTLKVRVSNPSAVMAGKTTDVEISLKSNPVNLSFKGKATSGAGNAVAGRVELDVPSVRKLAAWAGSPLNAPGSGLGPLKIAGDLDMKDKQVAFRQAKLSLDAISGSGDLSVDQRGSKPMIRAKLDLGTLDLNPYLPPEKAGSQPAQPAAGKAGPGDWSDDPIDLTGLNAANADVDLNVGGLVVRKIKIGESNLKVELKNGTLVTDLTKMALYGGVGKARVTTRGGRGVPTVTMTSELTKFQANPFMRDAMNFDRVEGTANANVILNTKGRTQREMIKALGGSGKLAFNDGAIKGINLGAMVRNVQSAFLDPSASQAQKTDFSEMGGTFVIANGILKNDDLNMKSPLLRLSGKGTVDLPNRRIDYRVEPKVVASAQGQGATGGAAGVSVPVNIKGPWHDVSYSPDLGAALGNVAKDPKKALDSVKGLVPGIGGLTGSDGKKKGDSPVEGLKGLFGR